VNKRRFLLGIIWSFVLFLGVDAPELAVCEPAKPEFTLKLMGVNRTLDPCKLYEEWAHTVEQRSDGRVKFDFTSLPELGLGGAEQIRVLKTGTVDIVETYAGFVAGELPLLEILELPGMYPNVDTAKEAIRAWKPAEAKIFAERANAVVLAVAVYPDQVFFSRKPIRKMTDFKGLKVRVHSVALASMVAGLGGDPLNLPFAETYKALERGTVDAAISGTKPGAGLQFYEVSKYLVGPIFLRPHIAFAVNRNTWNKLPQDIQNIMKEEAESIIEGRTFEMIKVWNKEGYEICLAKGMEHSPFSPEIQTALQEVLRSRVAPDWVRRAGGQEAAQFLTKSSPL
jgi:TRAP-type C4-dicarboxylate transport system substrate-binding protein